MPECLVLCGDAKHAGGHSALRLALSGRSQNITLKLEEISKKLVRNIPSLLIDLIEIATYVFCADQAISRGGEVQQGMGADWRREFRFVIQVRNPGHWNRRNVSEALCSTLSFLSDDNYTFEFEKATHPVPFQNYLEFSGDSGVEFKPDEIALFSGGLDSLSGAIEELSKNGTRVALVSHRSSSKIFDHQKYLVAELKQRFPNYVMHIPVLATRQGPLRVKEHTQRTRSFLYAALACVVARLFGNSRIRFFENGVVSINLPISEQVVGARATHTTHPLVLKHFREFFSVAVGEPIEVWNPFIWKTKADVIQSIVDHDCGGLIKHTVSYTRTYDITKLHTHCGCCSQCLDRRFAILAAEAAEHDPVEMYKVELLTGARDRPNDQTMAESYVRTALELREMGELAFFGKFSGEAARVCAGFPSLRPDDIARQVFDLHQRHGQGIGNVLKAAVEEYSAELVSRSLSPSSVLMMTIAPGGAPTLATTDMLGDAIMTWIDEAEAESASGDQRGGAYVPDGAPIHGRMRRGHGKSSPALERARGAIKELYPNGVPCQSAEPNANLCRRIGEKLKQAGLPDVSDDTILRAAGRRK
jgi:7-cyano-7-deazaguanine synthase in queuosine biosynthesis